MKVSLIYFCSILLCCNLQAQSYFTLKLYDAGYQPVESGVYGGHLADFFENCFCYDPFAAPGTDASIDKCMQLFGELKHETVRFPSGGNNKYMHPFLGPGYGYNIDDIYEMYDSGMISLGEVETYEEAVERQNTFPDSIRFLDRLVDLIWNTDTVYGKRPAVIYVAGLTLARRLPYKYNVVDENMAVLRFLHANGIEIAGVAMGHEHYRDQELFATFDDYYNFCLPLIDSIRADPELSDLKIGLVAAPEPETNILYELGNVEISKNWNSALRTHSDNDTLHTFDAFIEHIYYKPLYCGQCYVNYTDYYYDSLPNYEIPYDYPDSTLQSLFLCARDSIDSFTEHILPKMFERFGASDSSYCLGTDKEYWITEWGMKPPKDEAISVDGQVLQGSFNNTFIDAVHTLRYLFALNDINLREKARITVATKHSTNGGFIYGSFSASSNYIDPPDSLFLARANYFALSLTQPVFDKAMRPMKTDTKCLNAAGELISCNNSNKPFIRIYIDDASSEIIATGGCSGTGTTELDPWLWIYFANTTAQTMELNKNLLEVTDPVSGDNYSPVFSDIAFMKYLQADQLYSHAGDNSPMLDNYYYQDTTVNPQLRQFTFQVVELCNDSAIILPPYSIGYLNLELSDSQSSDETQENSISLELYPNPAGEYLVLHNRNTSHMYPNTLRLLDLNNRIVFETRLILSEVQQVQIPNLASGPYMCLVGNENSIVLKKLIVIE